MKMVLAANLGEKTLERAAEDNNVEEAGGWK